MSREARHRNTTNDDDHAPHPPMAVMLPRTWDERIDSLRHVSALLCDALAMTDCAVDAVQRVVLALGLEDDIPLWEVADDCRAYGVTAPGMAGLEVLAAVLIGLARKDQIRIRVGLWNDPQPRDVNIAEAEPLLLDWRRYSSAEEIANKLERVYYVNADNIVE